MRKIPILFLSILLSGLLFVPIKSSFAMMEDRGTTWWTVEELLEFYQEVEQEKAQTCGDDQDCKTEFNYSMYEKGPKYSALENLIQGQFWITSVNPAAETIKVLFFDEDMMLRHMGIEEKLELEHLYIAWFENWKSQVYNKDYEHFYDGYMEGLHKMYAGISSIDGPGWIPAWQEVELSVAGSNLADNIQGIITFSVFAEDNMFNAQGSTNYLNCLGEPDYTHGTECKMYISDDQGISFFPPRNQISNQTDLEESNPTPYEPEQNFDLDSPITEQSDPIIVDTPTKSSEMELSELKGSESEPWMSEPKANRIHVTINPTESNGLEILALKAPETGQGINAEIDTETSIVLLIPIVAGVLVLIWWFIPTEAQRIRKKHQKSQKNP